jgi:hypothetical protein
MTHVSVAFAAALAIVAVPGGALQVPADFSGTWTMDLEHSESPHQGTGFEVPTLVIRQTPAAVSVETRRPSGTTTVNYTMSSAKAPEPGPATPGRAYWDGAVLVTEGTRVVQGQTVSLRERRSLDATGRQMTVETLLVVQHGYSFRGGQNYGAAKDVYTRAVPDLRTR